MHLLPPRDPDSMQRYRLPLHVAVHVFIVNRTTMSEIVISSGAQPVSAEEINFISVAQPAKRRQHIANDQVNGLGLLIVSSPPSLNQRA